ncbi:MAG: hypothetical protein KDK70_32885, partial [Myxococcales bacterium]|nr:hypothetical protein [Myxococcales bacterium]
MVWSKVFGVVLVCGVGLACGPGSPTAVGTETDTETDTEGSSGTTNGTNPTTTSPTTTPTTVASMSGTATTGEDTADTADTGSETTPPTTGECPYGTEGCLCDVGAACDEGLDCNDDGICVAPPACRPLDQDPHGDEASATELDQLGCGDDTDLGLVATLQAPETDWFTFFGAEAFMCPEQPAAVAMALGITTEVCVYLECVEGTAVGLTCADGSTDATSPEGRPGCCGEDGAQITFYDCMGQFAGRDANVWISVGSD